MKRLLLTIALIASALAPVTSRAATYQDLDYYIGKNLKFVFTLYNSNEEGAAPFIAFTSEIIKSDDNKYYLTNFMNLGDLEIVKPSPYNECAFGSRPRPTKLTNATLKNSDGATFSMQAAKAEQNTEQTNVTTYKYNSSKYIPGFFSDSDLTDFITNNSQSQTLTKSVPLLIEYGKTDDKKTSVVSKITITVLQQFQNFSYADAPDRPVYSGYTTSNNIFNYGNLGLSISCTSQLTTEPYTMTIPARKLYTENDVTTSGTYNSYTITTNSDKTTEYWLCGPDGGDITAPLTPSAFYVTGANKWFSGGEAGKSAPSIKVTSYSAETPAATVRNNTTGEIVKEIPGCIFSLNATTANIRPSANITVNKIGYDNVHGLYANVTAQITKAQWLVEDFDVMVIAAQKFTSISYAKTPDGTSIAADNTSGLQGAYVLSDYTTEWMPEQAATLEALADDGAAADENTPDMTKTINAQIESLKDAYSESTTNANKNFTFYIRYRIKNDSNSPRFGNLKSQNLTGDIVTGVEDAVIDNSNDAAPAYYNLQGARVYNPTNGIFIEVRGGKVTKVIK